MARKIHKIEEPKPDLMRWLLTYADMITLLMLFFIIMCAISSLNTAKYSELAEALANVFNGGNLTVFDTRNNGGPGLLEGVSPGKRIAARQGGRAAAAGGQSLLRNQALSSLQTLIKAGKVRVVPMERGFAISLVSDMYFATASATLGSAAYPVLQEVSDFLAQIPNSIEVEGHTDNIPPDQKRWSSNWQLSSERAITVLQTLEDYGIPPDRLSATAFGSTRPIQSNDAAEGRAYNRRVDIIIVEQP